MGANSSASQSSRLRPLPTTDKLRYLPPLPQGSMALSISRQLRTLDGNYDTKKDAKKMPGMNPPVA
jgi:hypothetical protein